MKTILHFEKSLMKINRRMTKKMSHIHSRMDRIKNWFNIDKTFILTHTAETSFREAFVVETFRETHNFQILKWIHFRMQGSCIIEWTFFGV